MVTFLPFPGLRPNIKAGEHARIASDEVINSW